RNSAGRSLTTQRVLVVVQVALTLVLLNGGGLLFRTILNLWSGNPGFDAQHVITFQGGLSRSATARASGVRDAYQQLVERSHGLPGGESAEIRWLAPFGRHSNEGPFWLRSHPPVSMAELPRVI